MDKHKLHPALIPALPVSPGVGVIAIREECNRLAHELAEASAKSAIDCHSNTETVDGQLWNDLSGDAFEGATVLHVLEDDLRYLGLRGMLEIHPQRPNLVRIVGD